MSNPTYTNLPVEKLGEDALAELALNLRSSWNHSADELWGKLDPELWELTQNPWVVLQTVSRDKLRNVAFNGQAGSGTTWSTFYGPSVEINYLRGEISTTGY